MRSLGGKQIGVGFLTTTPCRPLVQLWPDAVHQTARVCAHTFLHQNHWIHGATCYGKASNAHSVEGRQEMDSMLQHVTTRVVHNMKGKRFICGDFNHLHGTLEQTALWEQLGWKEVQLLHQERTGQEPRVTCQDTTIKDFLWISPELVPYFQEILYDNVIFKDHAMIGATFRDFGPPERIPIWRKPKSLDWDTIGTLPTGTFTFAECATKDDPCQHLATHFEARVCQQLEAKDCPPLMRCQLGRARTTEATWVTEYSRPTPPSRHGSVQPQYGGISIQYNQWFKQLRRLEAFARAQQKQSTSQARLVHCHREWRAILRAPGFTPGFAKWWPLHMPALAGFPRDIPVDPPSAAVAWSLCHAFEHEVRRFEQVLIQDLTQKARHNRLTNPSKIFADVQKPKVSPVQMLDDSKVSTITDIQDDHSIVIEPPQDFDLSQPVYTSSGPVEVIHATPDQLWLAGTAHITVGQSLRPCSVMFTRLQQIGWSWQDHTFIDHRGLPIDVWYCCIQELGIRLTEAWHHHILQQLASRKTFAGCHHMHARFTTADMPVDPAQQQLLKHSLCGTFFTANFLKYREGEHSDACAFCGAPDSPEHRQWHCPALESARVEMPEAYRQEVQTMPLVTRCHGWMPAPQHLDRLRSHLLQVPDDVEFVLPSPLPPVLDVFTDGSCLYPHHMFCKLASWGVVVYQPSSPDDFAPVASGLLPGFHQTILRAELQGAIQAFRYAMVVQRPFRLWVDNQQVHKYLRRLMRLPSWRPKPTKPNHDLLVTLCQLVEQTHHLFRDCIKVYSHQDKSSLSPAEAWACAGNAAADALAASVWLTPSAILDLVHKVFHEHAHLTVVKQWCHKVYVNIGELVRTKPVLHDDDPGQVQPDHIFQLDMRTWTFPTALSGSAARYYIDDWPHIREWVDTLHTGTETAWWSWYQLYADFQLRYPDKGPWYSIKDKRWYSRSAMPPSPFVTRARWLTTFLGQIAHALERPLPTEKVKPHSTVIGFWINCLTVRVTPARQQQVDQWLGSHKPTFLRSSELACIPKPACLAAPKVGSRLVRCGLPQPCKQSV
eukprot:Skav224816  [mRNA]  locus=scaffold21:141297:147109:- [translate_table: standard]